MALRTRGSSGSSEGKGCEVMEIEELFWKCSECGGELYKAPKTGAGVKTCKKCGTVWFILKLREGKGEE